MARIKAVLLSALRHERERERERVGLAWRVKKGSIERAHIPFSSVS